MKKFFAAAAANIRVAGQYLRLLAPRVFNDVAALTGVICIVHGIAMIYKPAGWIVGGILLIVAVYIRELMRARGAK